MPQLLERIPPLTWRQAIGLAVVSLGTAIALAEAYRFVGSLGSWAEPAWLAAALVHSVLAAAVLFFWLRRDPGLFRLGSWRAYVPALLILGGACGLALASRQFMSDPASGPLHDATTVWPWIFWVPIVEELVFRAGVGRLFRRLAPPLWAAWFAALVFALVHANPTLANVLSAKIGLALGPFLLGLCCEAVVGLTGKIVPAIALHAACNATVALFSAMDGRWLHWLGLLYS